MTWPSLVAAGSLIFPSDRAYQHARRHAARQHAPQPASWWGLCALLSQHYMRRGRLRPTPELWSELLPFLLIDREAEAARALESYLDYLEDPVRVDLQWLGLALNDAIAVADLWNDQVAMLLELPAAALGARWMALLSYESLQHLHRAVELYDSDRARTLRRTCWHGLPAPDESLAARGRSSTGAVGTARSGFAAAGPRPGDLPKLRRYRRSVPITLS